MNALIIELFIYYANTYFSNTLFGENLAQGKNEIFGVDLIWCS